MTNQLNSGATLSLSNSGPAAATLPKSEPDAGVNAPPMFQAIKRKSLPTGVASNVKQHVLVLSDISTSMSGSKLDELILARHALIAELADPLNKDGFLLTIIDFNHDADIVCSVEPAAGLILPDPVASGGTDFDAPLKGATNEIRAINSRPNDEGWHYLRPFVVVLSDGCGPVDDKSIQDLHEEATVIVVAYGSDADQATLSRIATDGQVHVVRTDGGALREFFADVGKTMTSMMVSAI